MIEVPSGALGAARLARHADFFSIGTNDLIQYLFAVDRLNGAVADIGDVLEPDVLTLIGSVVEAGHANEAWVGVCGEAAGDPTVAGALVGLGVDELSMTKVAIPEVKDALRRLTRERMPRGRPRRDRRCRGRRRVAHDPRGTAPHVARVLTGCFTGCASLETAAQYRS